MSTIVDRFEKIKLKISSLKPVKPVNIIAVSKTFPLDHINAFNKITVIYILVKIKFKKHCKMVRNKKRKPII